MRKIILGLGTIAVVAAASIAATGAFFSDTAEATGNVFSAGTLTLKIAKDTGSGPGSYGDTKNAAWNFSNMAPGGTPEEQVLWLKNVGTIDGMKLGISASNSGTSGFGKQIRITKLTLDDSNLLTGGAGADLATYEAPTNCTVTVSGSGTLTGALSSVNNGDVICLTGSDYSTAWEGGPVNVNKSVTIAAATGPSAQKISAGLVINVPNVTVQGFTLAPASVLGEKAAVYFNVGDQSGTIIRDNDIVGTGGAGERGVIVATGGTNTGVEIVNNEIHNLTTGIYTNTHTGTISIKNNSIYDSESGIGGFTGADVQYNILWNNSSEDIGGDSSTSGVTLKFNNILSSIGVAKYGAWPAYDNGGSPIVAQQNWWGDFDATDNVRGNVDTSNAAGGPFSGLINGTDQNSNGYADLQDLAVTTLTNAPVGLDAGEEKKLVIAVQVDGPSTDNTFQGASLTTDLTFTLSQQ